MNYIIFFLHCIKMSPNQEMTNQNNVTTSNIKELHKNVMQELYRFIKKRE